MNISCVALDIGYDQPLLAEPMNFSIDSGSMHFLIGSNGVGKSTLLRTLAGHLAPQGGEVQFSGQPIHQMSPTTRSGHIAYLGGRNHIHSRITLDDFLRIGLRQQLPDEVSISKVCVRLGLQVYRDQLVTMLSDGLMQKAAIGLTLLRESSVILLDEPLSHLDPLARKEMLSLLRDLSLERVVILSTHHVGEELESEERALALCADKKFRFYDSMELGSMRTLKKIYGD